MGTALLQEIRFAWRSLLRSPWFTLTAVLMLSVGLGLAMYMFGAIQSFGMRPPPFPNGVDLVHMEYANSRTQMESIEVPLPDWLQMRRSQTSLHSLEAFSTGTINLSGDDRPERYNGAFVSAGAFAALGVKPILGPGFAAGDDEPGAALKVVIAHSVWQERFGGDRDAIGTTMRVNGRDATLAGVMPPGFAFPIVNDVWIPIDTGYSGARREAPTLEVFGLPREGVGVARIAQELDALLDRINAADPQPMFVDRVDVKPYQEEFFSPQTRRIMGTMFASVLLVLLIACANVANLMVARASRRSRESAIRSAVGASRGRLVVAGLSEALLICLTAAAIGFALAQIGGELTMEAIRSSEDPPPYWMTEMRVDALSVLFALGVGLLAAVLAGLWPAWRAARGADAQGMREGGSGALGGGRVGRGLTTVEIALCVVLLATAGLTVRSVIERQRIDLPFVSEGVLSGRMGLFEGAYPDDAALVDFADSLQRELAAVPGARSAAITSSIPFSFNGGSQMELDGQPAPDGETLPFAGTVSADAGYFDTLGIALLRGRMFDSGDIAGKPQVALVSTTAAERWWPGEDPLGKRLRFGAPDQPDRPLVTVVGVVPHVPQNGDDVDTQIIYRPFAQAPTRFLSFAVRTDGDPYAMAEGVRAAVQRVDPDLPVYWLRTLREWIDIAAFDHRLLAALFGMFGAFAVLLAAAGLYAVLAYQVSQRTREIGVRRALGANDGGIVRMVVRQGAWQLGIGLAVGLVLALGFAQLLSNFLFGITAHDPLTFASVLGLLCAVALLSALVPTRRALQVAPMQALREN
ncbi:MAG TPA: ABC transporter permease [Xanthomonadaceae bacterium]|nr:ABC transporter permease [Xanthomonadaceae bacterium]